MRLRRPERTPVSRACHWAGETTRAGPLGSFESRTATTPVRWAATSTQFWPSGLLWLLLRQGRVATSTQFWPSPVLLVLLRHAAAVRSGWRTGIPCLPAADRVADH